jgi:hypothetical protein
MSIVCKFCSAHFVSRYNLTRHQQSVHNRTQYGGGIYRRPSPYQYGGQTSELSNQDAGDNEQEPGDNEQEPDDEDVDADIEAESADDDEDEKEDNFWRLIFQMALKAQTILSTDIDDVLLGKKWERLIQEVHKSYHRFINLNKARAESDITKQIEATENCVEKNLGIIDAEEIEDEAWRVRWPLLKKFLQKNNDLYEDEVANRRADTEAAVKEVDEKNKQITRISGFYR